MARIRPFAPLRYNPQRIPDVGAVIAPPYDVISEEKRAQLVARDRHNIIRLILPEGDESAKYREAGELFAQWMRDEILVREPGEAIYVYAQRFAHPATGQSIERLGFMACVKLEPFSAGVILPHERTLSGPKADRLRLMETTDANLEPIFGVYRDANARSSERLRDAASGEPFVHAHDSDGVEHTLWRVEDSESVAALRDDLSASTIFIVDGHHRYETALTYRAQKHAEQPSLPADSPVDFIMMFLAPTSDPGLVILPTHRVVHSLASFDSPTLMNALAEYFELAEVASEEEGLARLKQHRDSPSFLLLHDDRITLASLRDRAAALFGPDIPGVLADLDVTILHELILERILGITKEAQAAQTNLRYVKSAEEAFAESRRPGVQLVALMNPTRLEQVERVAESGQVMPQKSTYFYPKLASGLLINPLW
jgi:uncharacterized protein (DUF1015 family)